ncbi:MAG: glycosyltransferase family 4 protein [Candidatus Eisenbacteria bacterium]
MSRTIPAKPTVAYVLRAFPRLSETFILNEILSLRRRGIAVRIYAMERAADGARHRAAELLLPSVHWVPSAAMASERRPGGAARSRRGEQRARDRIAHEAAGRWIGRDLVRSGVDHVHAHFAGPAATAAFVAASAAGKSFTFTAHAKDIFSAGVDWKWLRPLSRAAHAVVTVSDYNRRYLLGRLPGSRVVRIYNGLDLALWKPARSTGTARPGQIVAVGRLVRKKGIHVLIEAMGLLRDRKIPLRAAIVGDGVERADLESRIERAGLRRHVRMPGAKPEHKVRRLVREASIVCLPCIVDRDGNQDALPTILLEAAAAGIPAVSTRVAGVPEIIQHGKTGLLVPPDDPVALAAGLERLSKSAVLRRRMGRNARCRAESRFDGRSAAAALERLFRSAIRSSAEEVPRARGARLR